MAEPIRRFRRPPPVEGLSATTVNLPKSLLHTLRIEAQKNSWSLSVLVENAAKEWLQKREIPIAPMPERGRKT